MELVRELWQNERSNSFCLDFFVTFFIKKKSKKSQFQKYPDALTLKVRIVNFDRDAANL